MIEKKSVVSPCPISVTSNGPGSAGDSGVQNALEKLRNGGWLNDISIAVNSLAAGGTEDTLRELFSICLQKQQYSSATISGALWAIPLLITAKFPRSEALITEATKLLLSQLDSEEPGILWKSAAAIGSLALLVTKIDPTGPETVAVFCKAKGKLLDLLTHPKTDVCISAIKALGPFAELGPSEDVRGKLADLIQEKNPEVSAAALKVCSLYHIPHCSPISPVKDSDKNLGNFRPLTLKVVFERLTGLFGAIFFSPTRKEGEVIP